MFLKTGELFYPAYQGEPAWDDFITPGSEDLMEASGLFGTSPNLGPSALAEFFGDHMVVNGMIWPYELVEPRNYRLHLLNGTDSRFMALRFHSVPAGATSVPENSIALDFTVIGSDQGLADTAITTDMLLSEPGSRYDIVFDFKGLQGQRIIMGNIGGDEPFGGDIPGPQVYGETDRVMAFDVALGDDIPDSFNPANISNSHIPNINTVNRTRKVALFEGSDEFGRLQPLLGTAEKATDWDGQPINWPATKEFEDAGLTGQMEGSMAWDNPITENPKVGDTEIWEIYNATGDAHPVHLHLVHFDVLDRHEFTADVIDQSVVQHNGAVGEGFRLENISVGASVPQPDGYVENAPKDMVTALPEQVTRIKMTFDKPGRYVWHCHILSHEDHEMMRVLYVGPGA
jgi:FtsP/CotA-like multicopper oxidase with cupredoxin domain